MSYPSVELETQADRVTQNPGGFLPVGRREWRIHFKKRFGCFCVRLGRGGVGWGVGGLSVVSLVRGVVIVGLLCVCFLLPQHLLPQSQHEHAGTFSFSAATAAAWRARRRAVRLAFTSACFAGLPKRLLFFFATSLSLNPEWLASARCLRHVPKTACNAWGALAYFWGSDVVQSPWDWPTRGVVARRL